MEFFVIITEPNGTTRFLRINGTAADTPSSAVNYAKASYASPGATVTFVGSNLGEAVNRGFPQDGGEVAETPALANARDVTNTGEAAIRNRQLTAASGDPSGSTGLATKDRLAGIFRNFLQTQGINPEGLGSIGAINQFAPATAATQIGAALAAEGLQGLPTALQGGFQNFIAGAGLGGIQGQAANLFDYVRAANAAGAGENRFLNPAFAMSATGDVGTDIPMLEKLARAAASEKYGSYAAQGLPGTGTVRERFSQNPSFAGGFNEFQAQQLGLSPSQFLQ